MSFCTKCGNKINDNSKFCTNCGNAVSSIKCDDTVSSAKSLNKTNIHEEIHKIKLKAEQFKGDEFNMGNKININTITKLCNVANKELGVRISETEVLAHLGYSLLFKGKRGAMILIDGIINIRDENNKGFYFFSEMSQRPCLKNMGAFKGLWNVCIYSANKEIALPVFEEEQGKLALQLVELLYLHNNGLN